MFGKRKKARGVSSPSEFYERLIIIIGWLLLLALVAVSVGWVVRFLYSRFTTIHRSYTEPLKEMPMLPGREDNVVAELTVPGHGEAPANVMCLRAYPKKPFFAAKGVAPRQVGVPHPISSRRNDAHQS